MRKSFLRKASIVLLSATMLMATACNKEIEVKYDYNVNDYVQLGKYEDIAVTVDKTSIENQLVDDKIAEDIENNTTYSSVTGVQTCALPISAEVLLMGIRYWLLMLLQVRVHSQQGCLIQMVLQ